MPTAEQIMERLRRAETATLRSQGDEPGDKYVQVQILAGRNIQPIYLTDAQFQCLLGKGITLNSPREPHFIAQKLIECGVISI